MDKEMLDFLFFCYASYRQNVGHVKLDDACMMFEDKYSFTPVWVKEWERNTEK